MLVHPVSITAGLHYGEVFEQVALLQRRPEVPAGMPSDYAGMQSTRLLAAPARASLMLLVGCRNHIPNAQRTFNFGFRTWQLVESTSARCHQWCACHSTVLACHSLSWGMVLILRCLHAGLMTSCWAPDPLVRPSFTTVTQQLEVMLSKLMQDDAEAQARFVSDL
jgi:hypothetical protein